MKNKWIEFCSGIVTVKITGKTMERFLNKLTRNDLFIWQVKRRGPEIITFKMRLKDVSKLRILSRNSGCKVAFIQRDGLPFYFQKLLTNSGIIIGAVLFVLVILFLSNMIWKIEVEGAHPETEYKIRQQLTKMGVKVGKLQFFVDDVESIQRTLTDQIEEITWVGVELDGTIYQFKVVEKEEPEIQPDEGIQNLVAKKKAVIVDMFVEEGQTEVKVNDYVVPGQLLVSGTIGKEGEEKSIAAKGKVLGETWYLSEVMLPIESPIYGLTGNKQQRHFLKFHKLTIPIWGITKNKFSDYQLEEHEHRVYFINWKLPISYVKNTYREREKVTRIYSHEEAIKTAKELARKDILDSLDEDAKIKGEKVLHQAIENGKVIIKIHFQVIENIAVGQPFKEITE